MAYYPEAFSPGSQQVLRQLFPDAVIASAADAMCLGLNAVSDGRHVVLPVEAVGLAGQLASRGFEPVFAAGPVRCMAGRHRRRSGRCHRHVCPSRRTGEIITGGSASVRDLRVGDCFDGAKDGEQVSSVRAVLCTQPHDAEVLAKMELPAGSYPGDAQVSSQVKRECTNQLRVLLKDSPMVDQLHIVTLSPTSQSWQDDRTGLCAVFPAGGGKLSAPVATKPRMYSALGPYTRSVGVTV